jgi:hypothetical protein
VSTETLERNRQRVRDIRQDKVIFAHEFEAFERDHPYATDTDRMLWAGITYEDYARNLTEFEFDLEAHGAAPWREVFFWRSRFDTTTPAVYRAVKTINHTWWDKQQLVGGAA